KTLWKPYGYFGDYASWEEAQKKAGGYDDASIFQRVQEASALVQQGKANFERDGIAFLEKFEWKALEYFRQAAGESKRLKVLDFGGALGSHYFPVKNALSDIDFDWTIVEQAGFVEIGKKEFATEKLHFADGLTEALKDSYDLVLFGCVLPYLEQPYEVLSLVCKAKIPFILIDKHPLIGGNRDRITVQRIPPSIYEASYPAWFFSQAKFESFMPPYQLVDSYWCDDIFNINSRFKTYFYQLKEKDGISSN
ncbi:MAG: methyltransferase, TIGR04325 family, partial [Bacteroidota bacterium]|nr:methyltransferase, TIGR04325 family [Bacteroidota bacterium]MDX5470574.1 methyltransferase, TIGR04325 family [Bacteroidota bacterium]